MVQRSAGGPGKVDRRYRQARTSYEPPRAARDAAGVSGSKDRRGDRRRPPVCGTQHHRNDPENRTAPALERANSKLWNPNRLTRLSRLRLGVQGRTSLPARWSAGPQMDIPKSRTENFARILRSLAAAGFLRVHGRTSIAPHAPILSLLHNVGKHARLCGGEGGIRTPETLSSLHAFQACALNRARPPLRARTCDYASRKRAEPVRRLSGLR
jgi:hypothetical protein